MNDHQLVQKTIQKMQEYKKDTCIFSPYFCLYRNVANSDPNFVISEISVNQLRKCFPTWGLCCSGPVFQMLQLQEVSAHFSQFHVRPVSSLLTKTALFASNMTQGTCIHMLEILHLILCYFFAQHSHCKEVWSCNSRSAAGKDSFRTRF